MRRMCCLFLLALCLLLPALARGEGLVDASGDDLGGDSKIAQSGGQVYVIQEGSVYRMAADGTDAIPLTDGLASGRLNAEGGFLYWVCYNQGEAAYGIYRLPIAGGEPQKLYDRIVYQMRAMGEYVYFIEQTGASSTALYLFRMRADGTELISLTAEPYRDFVVGDGALFGFWERFDSQRKDWMRGIDRISPVDGSVQPLVSGQPRALAGFSAGHVYYTDGEASLWRANPDGTPPEKVSEALPDLSAYGLYGCCVVDGEIYSFEDTWRVHPWKTPTGLQGGTPAGNVYRQVPGAERKILYEGVCNDVQVAGGWMRFREYDEAQGSYQYRLMRVDGS